MSVKATFDFDESKKQMIRFLELVDDSIVLITKLRNDMDEAGKAANLNFFKKISSILGESLEGMGTIKGAMEDIYNGIVVYSNDVANFSDDTTGL